MGRIVLPGEPLVDGETALRPWRDADAPGLTVACQDPEIARWTRVPAPYRETDARAFLHQRYDAIHAGMMAPFAIAAATDGRLLGSISLMRLSWEHARGEVGYWLGRDARGQGHATRAVRAICGWGFATLRLERIDLIAATANRASQRVAERSMFTREAIFRSHTHGATGRHDMVAYRLLPSELATDRRA